jgi:hypothetical protein
MKTEFLLINLFLLNSQMEISKPRLKSKKKRNLSRTKNLLFLPLYLSPKPSFSHNIFVNFSEIMTKHLQNALEIINWLCIKIFTVYNTILQIIDWTNFKDQVDLWQIYFTVSTSCGVLIRFASFKDHKNVGNILILVIFFMFRFMRAFFTNAQNTKRQNWTCP